MKTQLTIFDAIESKRARDEGIDITTMNESELWRYRAMSVIRDIPPGWTGIGEDIRHKILESGIGEPHHPNVWGAIIMAATKRNWLKRTGQMQRAKAKKSHASTYPVMIKL